MDLDFEQCYRAVASRDPRFDGRFFTAVTSTGIYCRPSCPALTPRRRNVRFYPSAAAAQRNGFRACRRCRPDAVPGSPDWDARADLVGRAMRLISDGVVDREGVPGLARRLAYTGRHLNRMLTAELGAGPLALARAQRAQTARLLVETTDLGLAEIAFAAGFGSVRQFNDTIQQVYAVPPSALRAAARRRPDSAARTAGTVALRLPYRPPLHAAALLEFLAARAVPGVESVDAGGYQRALRLPHGAATVALAPAGGHVAATLCLADMRDLAPAVARCRRLLDLDADPVAIDAVLGQDLALAPAVASEPGVRAPRAVDGFEIAVRAVVGQQISVPGARRVLARLVAAQPPTRPATLPGPATPPSDHTAAAHPAAPADYATVPGPATPAAPTAGAPGANPGQAGGVARPESSPLRPFPDAEILLGLPDDAFAMPGARRRTLRALARAVVDRELDLDPGADRAETERRLLALPGIGPWTASYVALRALGDPDAFLPTDLGVRRGATALGLPGDPAALDSHAARWRPWRSYAVIRLWRTS